MPTRLGFRVSGAVFQSLRGLDVGLLLLNSRLEACLADRACAFLGVQNDIDEKLTTIKAEKSKRFDAMPETLKGGMPTT